jgi:flagellar motor switch protein FliM
MPSSISRDRAPAYPVLDPTLLGRPVHLLPQFAARLGDALGAAMRLPARRRYWDAFDLDGVEFTRAPEPAALRWLAVACGHGSATVAFERPLLLALLDWRYARTATPAGGRDLSERVTATEERLALLLTRQLAEVLAAQVAAGLLASGAAAPQSSLVPVAASAPAAGSWAIRLVLRGHGDERGTVWFALDQQLMADILRGLLPPARARDTGAAAEPLAARLPVRLEGCLVSKEITLATLFGLQVGDIIPVSVGRADVLLDENRLFTAAVAEHKGKLCLTSFEDAE